MPERRGEHHPEGGRDGAALLERARAGDPSALEALLRRNEARLQRVASAKLGRGLRERVRSSDVLQSTYLQVLQSVRTFGGSSEADFANWVVRILENTIRDRARYFSTGKRDRALEARADVREIDPADKRSTPSSEVALGEELARIAQAMQRLPKDYVRVLTLHMDPERTHRETARLLNRSEGASRVLLARARAKLLLEMEHLKRGAGDA